MRQLTLPLLLPVILALGGTFEPGPEKRLLAKDLSADECPEDLCLVFGRIQVVESFPDCKVRVVQSFEDMRVQVVENFPDAAGKWQFVESFPDYRIQFVDSFADFTIRYVDSFPGVDGD